MTRGQAPTRRHTSALVGVTLFLIVLAVLVAVFVYRRNRQSTLDGDLVITGVLGSALVLGVVAFVAARRGGALLALVALLALAAPTAVVLEDPDHIAAAAAAAFTPGPRAAGLQTIDEPSGVGGPIVMIGEGDATFEVDLTAVTMDPAVMRSTTTATPAVRSAESETGTGVPVTEIVLRPADGSPLPPGIRYRDADSVIVEARGPTAVHVRSTGAWSITITPSALVPMLEGGDTDATVVRVPSSGTWSVSPATAATCTWWDPRFDQASAWPCPSDPKRIDANGLIIIGSPGPGCGTPWRLTFTPDA